MYLDIFYMNCPVAHFVIKLRSATRDHGFSPASLCEEGRAAKGDKITLTVPLLFCFHMDYQELHAYFLIQ